MANGGRGSRFRDLGCPRLTLAEATGPGPSGTGRGWQEPFELETKYDALLTIKFLRPGDKAHDQVLDARDYAMHKILQRHGRRLSGREILDYTHTNAPETLPIFVHTEEDFGVWLVPNSRDSWSTLVAWGLNRLQERWDLCAVGVRCSAGHLLLAGRLSRSEITDLQRGVFPASLEEIGKPGDSFGGVPQTVSGIPNGENGADQLQRSLASLNLFPGGDSPSHRNQEYGGLQTEQDLNDAQPSRLDGRTRRGDHVEAIGRSRQTHYPSATPHQYGESKLEPGQYDAQASSYGEASRKDNSMEAVRHSCHTNYPSAAPDEHGGRQVGQDRLDALPSRRDGQIRRANLEESVGHSRQTNYPSVAPREYEDRRLGQDRYDAQPSRRGGRPRDETLDDAVGRSRNNHPSAARSNYGEIRIGEDSYDTLGTSFGGPSRKAKSVGAVRHSRQSNHPFAASRENFDIEGDEAHSRRSRGNEDSRKGNGGCSW